MFCVSIHNRSEECVRFWVNVSPIRNGCENPKEQSVIKKLSELKPYKSLLLARVQGSIPVENIVDGLLEDIRGITVAGKRWTSHASC